MKFQINSMRYVYLSANSHHVKTKQGSSAKRIWSQHTY
uniref:Uncharacterized protein n=1 Tax=Rhizophora mucronata TaxID=61149 RepID=A0A2P2NAQ0_RHIMU